MLPARHPSAKQTKQTSLGVRCRRCQTSYIPECSENLIPLFAKYNLVVFWYWVKKCLLLKCNRFYVKHLSVDLHMMNDSANLSLKMKNTHAKIMKLSFDLFSLHSGHWGCFCIVADNWLFTHLSQFWYLSEWCIYIFESESHINAPVCIMLQWHFKMFCIIARCWTLARLGTHFASFCKKWRGSVKFAKSLQEEGLKSLTCYLRCAICIPVNLIFKQIVNTI